MKKSLKIVLIVILAAALVGGGVLVGIKWNDWFGAATPEQQTAAEPTATHEKLEVDPNAGEYVTPEPTEAPDTGVAIPGWGSITWPADQTEVPVDFKNPDANADKYYLSFEVRLKDTGEVLCTTGLVPPGQTIQKITLSRALDAGEYTAVIHVQPYRMDEAQTPTNNADMETTLIIK